MCEKCSSSVGFGCCPVMIHVRVIAPLLPGRSPSVLLLFPVGVVIVTVESEIGVLLIVVGAVIVTIGGNLIVVCEELPAKSYAVTTIV